MDPEVKALLSDMELRLTAQEEKAIELDESLRGTRKLLIHGAKMLVGFDALNRELAQKVNIIADSHIRLEESHRRLEESHRRLEETHQKLEESIQRWFDRQNGKNH